jgi:ABC-type glycerol-3-phosphate transport system substrate-binding protein
MIDEHPVDELYSDDEGRLDRQELLRRGAAAGLAVPTISVLFGAGNAFARSSSRPLTPTFYQWIYNNHPDIPGTINKAYGKTHSLDAKIAPVAGFGIERFVAEAKQKKSTWDVYVGTTPFVEMAQLAETGAIEPWDPYMPAAVKRDIIPSIFKEVHYQGKIYSWPFLLDIIVQARNSEIVQKAGLDPSHNPRTWDELISMAKTVVDKKAAPFGVTFDAHGWRSLAPITHTFSPNVYYGPGLFNFTSPAAVSALEVMKRMKELANPNVLEPGTTDGGVNNTPDEGAFAARQVAYYVKYQNAPIRFAATWPDPSKLRMAGLPKQPGGVGATVFWTTGAALFRYGENKQLAADYMRYLTYSQLLWRSSMGTGLKGKHVPAGQIPPYTSLWVNWAKNPPSWLPAWGPLVFNQLKVSRAIRTNKFGLQQFVIGQPYWEKYLTGDETNPRKALLAAKNAVYQQYKKS